MKLNEQRGIDRDLKKSDWDPTKQEMINSL